MKLINVTLVILLVSGLVFAQSATEKGRILTDLNFAFSSTTIEHDDEEKTETDVSMLDADIRIGYAVIDDMELGVGLNMSNESKETSNEYYTYKTTENLMHVSLFARYFFMSGQQIRPFVGVIAGFGPVKLTTTGSEDMKFDMVTYGAGVGAAYFINEHWGVDLSLRYLMRSQNENDDHPSTDDMDHKGIQITFGTIVSF